MNFWDGERGGKPLFQGIRDCNIFLENIGKVPDLTEYEKQRWIAEVKFLKAYFHYYLMKCYGPIPVVDENLPISASVEEVKVFREPIDEVVKYIVNLIDESIADLPEANQIITGSEGGRIDKLIAMGIKAEVLLFSASPLFNGNTDLSGMIDSRGISLFSQTYDETKWKAAADACKEAIDACHEQNKELYNVVDQTITNAPDVFKLQTTYRQTITDRWNKELIWGGTNYSNWLLSRNTARIVPMAATQASACRPEWAPTIKMAELYYSKNGVPIDEDIDWQSNNWYNNRFKVRTEPSSGEEIYYVEKGKQTVFLHYNREPRFYASLGFDQGVHFGNGYYNFPDNVKYADFQLGGVSGKITNNYYSVTGYSVKKMSSFKNGQSFDGMNINYFPFPILRLADLYLMYAEALNEVSGPSEEVFYYLDLVRERAGLKGIKESWQNHSSNPNKPDSKNGLREIIHNERSIELAFEGKYFWDMRRWKKMEELNAQPEGWNILGTNTDDFYNKIIVAKEPAEFTTKNYFFPIKESNIYVNSNLLQNYGW